jgi:hypothetical protein
MVKKNHLFKHLLVRKLVNKRIIGGAHKPETSFLRFVKNHPDRKAVLTAYEELVKEGVIIRQKKNKDIHVSLTRDKKKFMRYVK